MPPLIQGNDVCGNVQLRLEEKVVVITGGSGGIGLAIPRGLLAEGARVLIVGRSEERLAEATEQLGGLGESLASLSADVTEPSTADRVRDVALTTFGRIDGLVNCAGSSSLTAIDHGPMANWYSQWELCVMGPKRLIDALGPALAEREGVSLSTASAVQAVGHLPPTPLPGCEARRGRPNSGVCAALRG
jgi:NAD(P)-dependent dehydrogenase (short-subunit alcohol dehydrogenase family)